MTLEDLGYNIFLEEYRKEQQLDSFEVGRVVSEHKERYTLKTPDKEYDAELIGSLRFTADSRRDFPAVGDWVAFSEYEENKALIHGVFPRKSIIERQAVGKFGEKQIIAVNVDYGLIVQAVDRDFNLNRLERYLTVCYAAKVNPVIILSKTDLADPQVLEKIQDEISRRLKDIPTIAISNQDQSGYDELKAILKTGKTYCLLGSSGVGKSTLMNGISGIDQMKTNTISSSTHKGRHVTSHRELIFLDGGGLLIDNPGMRELGIADAQSGLEITFNTIHELAQNCRFTDCTHTQENGCAVLEALETEEIDQDSYDNFLKMEKEKMFFESSVEEKRKKDKDLGKLIKNFKKNRHKNKY